jgi:hypothetical protein
METLLLIFLILALLGGIRLAGELIRIVLVIFLVLLVLGMIVPHVGAGTVLIIVIVLLLMGGGRRRYY